MRERLKKARNVSFDTNEGRTDWIKPVPEVPENKYIKQKAEETGADPMLLSWYQGKTGESYPNLECGPGDKPAWITYAESRGGDLTIDINEGQYVFIYLSV